MADSISVRGLTDEQVEALKKLVKLFREQRKTPISVEGGKNAGADDAQFVLGSRRSNVKGRLTREEIYEDR